MRDTERRKLDKFKREQAFMTAHAADFLAGSAGATAATTHTSIIDEMDGHAGTQISGAATASAAVENKDDLYDQLLVFIRHMNRAANAFSDVVPGSDMQFRMPRNQSQQNLLATARAFYTNATSLEANFVEYGFATTFLTDLQALIGSIETTNTAGDTSEEERASATFGLRDAAKRGMKNSGKLNAIVQIKYENDPQTLAAWAVARHLEKAPKSNSQPPGPANPPPPGP